MDEEYDAIILGTGIKECIIGGLLSVSGKKVLHMDKKTYYGGESASITPLEDLFARYGKPQSAFDESYGRGRDWNVDLIPKFFMGSGDLVRMLILSGVTRYLEVKRVEGSYVFYKGRLSPVPASAREVMASPALSLLEKRPFQDLINCVMEYTEEDGVPKEGYVKGMKTGDFFNLFGVFNLHDLIGHAMALHPDDDYFESPCEDTVKRIKLYFDSVPINGKSPYLYPLYGLGELPQGFARLSAIYGGTYMLDKPVEEIVMDGGKAVGVKSEGETARTKLVVGDPSYFPDLVKKTGQVVRAICILDHPIYSIGNDPTSTQIIFPCRQVPGRESDIYVCCVSFAHNVASKNFYIATASCKVETNDPLSELQIALDLLKPIKAQFDSVSDLYEPINDGTDNKIFITKSYDATTHFKSTCSDIKDVYKRVTGEDVDLTAADPSNLEEVSQ
ncbi:rab GDP dissociation inhibitor alpha-like [Acanthaster planci]|uniref:Rab GDP dissociation inhibitor n=1 Tax=Acanthaster planci TaxID=133434 RepID=A0A8B7XJJ3_ACAPL|nr:rab GDP dissociation inhibitor alpha-like [Acanthaster planci]XP_022080962.1 rab GDP dissociation inhibitor alpha-like [Acanthaster planci]XP_022080963.1 rab GDP dissociation inhibitor alpha-like [Acanthaster planci]XP_022080964.1 rab GDP dissociation inhibitor alpha-like [Acanthaster planci]XP_022080965.1 rab GDP dissociation inhibitor alpha-like [Acanthaster planci]